MDSATLPDGYLDVCSLEALESLELARLNKAANLRGEMKDVLRRWIEAEVDAKLARWMLEKRRSQQFRAGAAARLAPGQPALGSLTRALSPPAAATDDRQASFDGTIAAQQSPGGLSSPPRAVPPAAVPSPASARTSPPVTTIESDHSRRDIPAAVTCASGLSQSTKTPRPEGPPPIRNNAAHQPRLSLLWSEDAFRPNCAAAPATAPRTCSAREHWLASSNRNSREGPDLLPASAAIAELALTRWPRARLNRVAAPPARRARTLLSSRARRGSPSAHLLRSPDALRRLA